MILHGENLMISVDGSVLAASKSCNVDVDVDTIKVSSPTDGAWEHSIAGRKSWKVTTNHLLLNVGKTDALIEAMSQGHPNVVSTPEAWLKCGGEKTVVNSRGLTFFEISTSTYQKTSATNFDTYENETAMSNLASAIQNATSPLMALVSFDGFGMNETLRTAIATYFKVDMSNIPTGSIRASMVVIGSKATGAGNGIVMYRYPDGSTSWPPYGAPVHGKLYCLNGSPIDLTPVKSMLKKVGSSFDLRMQLDGYGSDTLHGSAICKSAKITATKGNLLQGSFAWKGTGKLE